MDVILKNKGIEVFKSLAAFEEWLELPNVSLGGQKPSNLISLQDGMEKVIDCLGRIQNGVFS